MSPPQLCFDGVEEEEYVPSLLSLPTSSSGETAAALPRNHIAQGNSSSTTPLKRHPDGTLRRLPGRCTRPLGFRWDDEQQRGGYVRAQEQGKSKDVKEDEDQERKPAAVGSAKKRRRSQPSPTPAAARMVLVVKEEEEEDGANPDPEGSKSQEHTSDDTSIFDPRQTSAPRQPNEDATYHQARPSRRTVPNQSRQSLEPPPPSPDHVASAAAAAAGTVVIPRTSTTLSVRTCASALQVGARVYAHWSEHHYFWAYIVKIVDTGSQRRYYNVLFEDGDIQQGLKSEQILTEKQFLDKHGSDPPPPITPAIRMLENMHLARCGRCFTCQHEDCGICRSCIFNQSSTTIHRRMCIMKMCQKLRAASKALPSRCFPGWTFYSTAAVAHPSSPVRFDPDMSGLRLCSPQGKVFDRLDTAMKCFGVPDIFQAVKEFGEHELGVTVRRIRDHKLIGKCYYHVWTDVSGRRLEIYGTIIQCLENLSDDARFFKVKYWDAYRTMINDAASIADHIPEVDLLEEAPATGGYLSFLEKTKSSVGASLFDLYCPTRFIAPVSISDFRAQTFSVLHDGIKLDFLRKRSDVPNAGEGLFVSATCVENEGWMGSPNAFVLEPGVLIDLGIYAPLRKDDRKPFHVHEIKSFIFAQKPDIWVFDTKSNGHDALDITDDNTGHLHEQAERNLLVRVNETDGKKEAPSIHAVHDPQGSVHYYLGSFDRRLRIPFGAEIELKIDYGPSYEQVRVRENYPRVSGSELAQAKVAQAAIDLDTLRDFFTFSAKDVHESLLFFEALLTPKWETSSLHRQRAMLAALSLYGRVRDIQDEFSVVPTPDLTRICDNGYSRMEDTDLAQRAKTVVRAIGRQIMDKAALKKKINRYYILQEVVFKHLRVNPATIKPEQLLDKLCDLP